VFQAKVSYAAAPVAEVFPSAEPGLLQFSAAQDTAVIVTAPDIVIQTDKTAVPGKSSGFAVELHLILIQMQRPADHMVSDALHTHSEDLLFLRIRHSFTLLKCRNSALLRCPHGLRQVKNGSCGKCCKMIYFIAFFVEKSPFSRDFCNEMLQDSNE
jgi:hypothetical protein